MPKENNKEKALTSLLECSSIAASAQTSGLSEKTLRRYLEDKEFLSYYRNARRIIFEQNIVRLQSLHTGAIDALKRNLTYENIHRLKFAPRKSSRSKSFSDETALIQIKILFPKSASDPEN